MQNREEMYNRIRIVATIILTICTIIGMVSFAILHIVYKNIKKDHVISTLEEMQIYDQIYDEIQSGFEEYIFQSGLEPKVFENLCTKEKINNDFTLVMNKLYGETNESIDTFEVKNNLDKEIKKYVAEQGITLNSEEQKHVEEYEDLITESYSNSMYSYLGIKDLLGERIDNLVSDVNAWKIAFFCVTCFYGGVLISINKGKKYTSLSYMGIAFFASGVLMIIISKVIKDNIDIEHIVIITKVLSNSIIYIARQVLFSIRDYGNIFINFGLFLMIISSILSEDLKKSPSKQYTIQNTPYYKNSMVSNNR